MAYIDRDLLLKDISESVVFTVRNAETSPELRGARKIIDRIKSQPTADVVEVVRCYNCKFFMQEETGTCSICNNDIVYPNDFCSYGIQKGE